MKTSQIFQFGEYCVDPLTRTLRRNDVPLALQRRAFDVLFYLVQNPGRIVPKDELMKNVWPDTFVDENNLAQSISSLRKALGQRPDEPSYLATLPGRGYQFIAPVQVSTPQTDLSVAEPVDAAIASNSFLLQQRTMTTSIVTQEVQPRPGARRRALAVPLAAAAVLAGGYAWWRHVPLEPPATATVVLADFVNTTGDATFDHTLRRALEVDLEQSPYMDVLSEKNGVSTLLLMGHRSDARLTPDVAREVCERTNRRVLIEGTISSIGPRYLLTLVATDCGTGKTLTSAKAEAADQERVLTSLDTVAARIRSRLGESAKSLASYQVPLKEATTPSLEALKAYSTGKYLQSQGRPRVESIAAFQRAVELDPNFAMAYRELGIENRNLSQYAFSRQYFQKANDLSGHLSNYEQLLIRADYYAYGQNNLIEGIRAFQVMSSAYPHDPGPVYAIMDASDILGQYDLSITTGERGLKLFPDNALIYENLGEAYMRVGRFDDCEEIMRKTAQIVKGDSGQPLGLFYIAFAKHDEAAVAQMSRWFDAHEDGATVWYFPAFRGEASAASGKYRQSLPLFENAYRSALRANLPETADKVLIDEAAAQLEIGLPEAAAATLRRIHEPAEGRPELVSLHAALGDTSFAEQFLAAHSASTPDTLMTYVYLPRVRAAVALERGRPLEAVAALEPARPYEMRDYTVPTLRGEAYLKLRLAESAIAEYRKILDHPGIDPVSVLYPLAHLGMARAYAMQNNMTESRHEYEALFALWKDADPNLAVVKQAHLEYAHLP